MYHVDMTATYSLGLSRSVLPDDTRQSSLASSAQSELTASVKPPQRTAKPAH